MEPRAPQGCAQALAAAERLSGADVATSTSPAKRCIIRAPYNYRPSPVNELTGSVQRRIFSWALGSPVGVVRLRPGEMYVQHGLHTPERNCPVTPTDLAQRTYLENRLEALIESQVDVVRTATTARATFEALPKRRLCPKEVARLEHRAIEAERRSADLLRAIAAISAELVVQR